MPAYVVNLHLSERAGPPIESKHLVRESYSLVPLQICHPAPSITRSLRNVFGAELFVQSRLKGCDLSSCEAIDDAFFERVLDVPTIVLVARPILFKVR